MQDFLPDVPEKPAEVVGPEEMEKTKAGEGEGVEEKEEVGGGKRVNWREKWSQLRARPKFFRRLVLVAVLGGLVSLGIVVTILESREAKEAAESQVKEEEFESRLALVEKKPGQMAWLFYEDGNNNREFEAGEKAFTKVSVAVRRVGEELAFRTEASDDLGRVMLDNLDEGEYEVQFLNYEQELPQVYGEFELPKIYELTDESKQRLEFIPSDWKRVELGGEGYKQIVGVREYEPKEVLVTSDGQEVWFYDPERAKVLGRSLWGDGVKRWLRLVGGKLVYLKDEQLQQFEFKTKIGSSVMDRVNEAGEAGYAVSADLETVVYDDDGEVGYLTKGDHCGDGGVVYEGQRLEVKTEPELLVDFWDKQDWVMAGRVREGDWEVYRLRCDNEEEFEAEPLEIGEVRALKVLDDKHLFYVNQKGSYFYDLDKQEAVKYTALGVAEKVKVSEDRKYVGGMVGGGYIVVDYPAVMASGVEKHYELGVDNLVFSGDEVLVNQAKVCGLDKDCGEVKVIKLLGNGNWDWGEAVDLVDVVVREVVGRIEL